MSGKNVTVLGGGAWGTAVSTLLANNGHNVTLWCFENSVAHDIETTRINHQYLPGFKLSENIHATNDLNTAIAGADYLFEALPVKYMRNVLQAAQKLVHKNQPWIILSKGIEQNTLKLPSQIIQEFFGVDVKIAVLGGPNFAQDLVEKAFTATVVASADTILTEELHDLLASDYFKPYISNDFIGVQVGGAIKNLMAVTVAIAHGAELKENSISFIFARGLQEIIKISEFYGGQRETIYGLSGLGDMILTSSSNRSRNFKIGKLLGQGLQLSDLSESFKIFPEGINTVQAVYQLVKDHNVHLPICQGTYEFIFQGKSFKNMLYNLTETKVEGEF